MDIMSKILGSLDKNQMVELVESMLKDMDKKGLSKTSIIYRKTELHLRLMKTQIEIKELEKLSSDGDDADELTRAFNK